MAGEAGYEVAFDEARGVVTCRIAPTFQDGDNAKLARDLKAVIARARASGPLRLLWDNKLLRVLTSEITNIVADRQSPRDRVAVLLPNSLAKAGARSSMVEHSETFVSENAALTWLGAAST